MRGIITKGIGGLYTVRANGNSFECSTRGKFRQKDKMSPMVGDFVELAELDGDSYAIDEIFERKNQLVRPYVANVDNLLITFAVKSPKPDLYLVDKLTVAAQMQNINVIICITKSDLKDAGEYEKIYKNVGFPVVVTSKKDGMPEELAFHLKDKITAIAGCSGVGKSTLINSFDEKFILETGEISEKIERGKQTTRHVELLLLSGGGYVLDTPGFSSFEVDTSERISDYFPEFEKDERCRFSDCTHINEPDCAVKQALYEGKISESRYESYKKMIADQKERSKIK